ncbi:ATP-binding cassette domain-containing protein [Kitasatospora sp. NPDC088391]|uniref:ATP-binding cassette domain-containing protein n=1 Tax=Kitasatospora sp. NPDC088391 TaxID=3364074 RepID=UPI0037F40DFB
MRGSSVALTVAVPLGAVSLSAVPWAVGALLDAVVTGGRFGPAAGWAAGGSAALLALAVSARAAPIPVPFRTAARVVSARTAAVRAVAAAGSVVGLAVLSPWLAAAFFAGVLPGVLLVRLFARSTAEFRPARPGPSRGRAVLLVTSVELTVLGTAGQLAAAGRLSAGACAAAVGWAALTLGLDPGPAFRRPTARLPRPTRELPDGSGELAFRSVLLRDAWGAVVFGPLELTVPGGWTVAVVGRPGAGRSQLAALTVGLRRPDGGAVLVDGVPVTALPVAARRRAVGCAFERPRLVGPAAAEAADSRVTVLDDAAWSPAAPADRRTRLVLTRRTAVAAGADLVLWLDGGRVRAVGPHADLLADPDYRAALLDAPTGPETAERCKTVDNCRRAPAN